MRIAVLAVAALAGSSCQTAQKPVAVAPPGTPPPLAAKASTTASPQAEAEASQPKQDMTHDPSAASAVSPETLPKPAADPVGDLVASVESKYQAGLAKYQAGQADAAKEDFDNAFNALLESKLDIRSDDRLQKEFDRISEGVNQLNLSDSAADSEAEKSEPAPIDETNGITPSADANTRAKAQAEIKSTHSDLPLMMTDQVAGYISYFSNRGRGTFERAFARSGRYHDMMVRILKQEGVPQDLIYLAQAESGFQPTAVSRAGARGIWQFMGSRARGYGLQHSMWVDDRQDPEKSTRAAAHHLKDLYAQFGDWYLAMAAYNSGPGTVQAAVKRTGYADFWELYRRNVLPKETRNYVPIILAVTIMTKNLSHYGFDDVSMDEPAAFDSVTINYPVDLRLVADCVDATLDPVAATKSQSAAAEYAQGRDFRASLARRDENTISDNHCFDSDRHARLVALSYGTFRGHSGIAGANLPHNPQVDQGSQSTRQCRASDECQADNPGCAQQTRQRYGNLCPPDHAL